MKRKPIEQKKNLSQADTRVPLGSTMEDTAARSQGGFLTVIKPLAFTILLFFAMTVQTGQMSLILCVLAVLSLIGKKPFVRFKARFCIPVLGLLAFAAMQGAAAIYSPFDANAVSEYYKFMAAFALAVILLARGDREDVSGLLWGLASVSAVIGLVSVDGACNGLLFDLFNRFVETLGASFSNVEQAQWGTQVAGIYNDANVTACLFALGSLVSLFLAEKQSRRLQKLLACLLVGVNALAFFLSMSRGAILCFGVALLVWLLAAEKGTRLSLFFLMAVSAASTVALSIPAASHIIAGSALPLVLLVVNGVVIFGLDWLVVRRLSSFFAVHVKGGAAAVVAVSLLCVAYLVAAFTVKGPYTFDSTGIVVRVVDLAPGDYTLTAPVTEDVQVMIFSQTPSEKSRDQYTRLYDSASGETSFTVPEGLAVVRLQLYAPEGTVVEAVTFSDGSFYQLGYPLLPAFAANRVLTGMGSSFTLRLEYDKDAWKIFLQSPVLGHGLASTENLYRSVQSFQYESKYVHNHILQVMCDTGLLGLAGFAALLLGSLWLLLKARQQNGDGLAAALIAAWVMMNLHSLMEINFSVRGFACYAFILLMLPAVLYARPILKEESNKQRVFNVAGIALSACFCLYLAVFGCLLKSHRMVEQTEYETNSIYEYLDMLKSCVDRDVFTRNSYELSYVANAAQLNSSKYNGAMMKYAAALRKSGTYENCSGLARYYYLPRGEWEDLFACSREGIRQVRSSPDGWNLQMDFYRTEVLPAMGVEYVDEFLSGVLAFGDALDAMNEEDRLEPVALSDDNQSFLTLCRSVSEQGLAGEVAYTILSMVSESQTES